MVIIDYCGKKLRIFYRIYNVSLLHVAISMYPHLTNKQLHRIGARKSKVCVVVYSVSIPATWLEAFRFMVQI